MDRKVGDCRERHGFEDVPKKHADGMTKRAWYTKSRAFECSRTRGLTKAQGLLEKGFDLWGE